MLKRIIYSTGWLVKIRFSSLLFRYFTFLTLVSVLSEKGFVSCGFAMALGEICRVICDGGLDQYLLRVSENKNNTFNCEAYKSALFIKSIYIIPVYLIGLFILWFTNNLTAMSFVLYSLFVSQCYVQLTLNVYQAENNVQNIAKYLIPIYLLLVLSAFIFAHLEISLIYIYILYISVEITFVVTAIFHKFTIALNIPKFRVEYLYKAFNFYYPKSLNMWILAIFALLTTKIDSIVFPQIFSPDVSGPWIYLTRVAEFACIICGGLTAPLVGKIQFFESKNFLRNAYRIFFVVSSLPVLIIILSLYFFPYSSDIDIRLLLIVMGIGSLRTVLVIVTPLLLAKWRDSQLTALSIFNGIFNTAAVVFLGPKFPIIVIGSLMFIADLINLYVQICILNRSYMYDAK